MTSQERATAIDLVELSDLAWTLVDPAGTHEREEQLWVASLSHDWPPPRTSPELRARLDQTVAALRPSADPGRLGLVEAVMCFLAVHPERRILDMALLQDAVTEAFGSEGPPVGVRQALTEGSERLAAHVRRHGAPQPKRHFHARLESGPAPDRP